MSCSRCRKDFLPSSSFCSNCGLYLREGSSGNNSPKLSIRNAQRRGKVSDKPVVGSKELTLGLPSEVLQSVDKILRTPVVAESVLLQRKEQRFKAQVYELKNAEDMEFAMGRRGVQLTGDAVNRISGNLSKGSTDSNSNNLNLDARAKHADSQYLRDVVSVASHYKTYLRRLKELEGLHVAMVERPKLPSEILSSKPR